MSPTIVLDQEGRVEMIAGASGGPRIITGTLQVLLNMMHGASMRHAVLSMRLHHQWLPDVVQVDWEEWFELELGPLYAEDPPEEQARKRDEAFNLSVERGPLSALAARGHAFVPRDAVGHVQAIRRLEDGRYAIASDPRKGGEPAYADR
jgi:gamma-glutamyltranspeptidase